MNKIEKTSKLDLYIDQIDKKEKLVLKKRIGVALGASILASLAFGYYLNDDSPQLPEAKNRIEIQEPVKQNISPIASAQITETEVDISSNYTSNPQTVSSQNSFSSTPREYTTSTTIGTNISTSPISKVSESVNLNETLPEVSSIKEEIKTNIAESKNTPTVTTENKNVNPKIISNPVETKSVSPPSPTQNKKLEVTTSNLTENTNVLQEENIIESAPSLETPKEDIPATIHEKKADRNFKAPSFPGGSRGLKKFIGKKIRYPMKAMDKKIEGTVNARIKINENGEITDAKIINGLGKECDQEVLRAIKEMPKWSPATLDGKAVDKYFIISVDFTLPKEK